MKSIKILKQCITGNFLNFSVLTFYNDMSFVELAKQAIESIIKIDKADLKVTNPGHISGVPQT